MDYVDKEEAEDGDYEESDGPQKDTWLRVFVAAYFVDSLLAGSKLLLDWLSVSPEFLKKAVSTYPCLMQQAAWHLAIVLNYLCPIVHEVETELRDETLRSCPFVGTLKKTILL